MYSAAKVIITQVKKSHAVSSPSFIVSSVHRSSYNFQTKLSSFLSCSSSQNVSKFPTNIKFTSAALDFRKNLFSQTLGPSTPISRNYHKKLTLQPSAAFQNVERVFDPSLSSHRPGFHLIQGDEVAHLRAKRIKLGDHIQIFNGYGLIVDATLVSIDRKEATVNLISDVSNQVFQTRNSPPLSLTTVFAFPDSARADWILEKLTELGVSFIIPLQTKFSVSSGRQMKDSSGRIPDAKFARYKRIFVAASKQSLCPILPQLDPHVHSVRDLVQKVKTLRDQSVFLLASPKGYSLRTACTTYLAHESNTRQVIVCVGPEGGFSEDEENLLMEAGAVPVSLGFNRLRIETALLAMVASVNSLLNE